MPVVVFEGPDEAGKTTLINATAQVLDNVGLPFTVVKSPAGKERHWEEGWDVWASTQGLDKRYEARHVFLLDRTPEISEWVYGILRNKTRLPQPLQALSSFKVSPKFLVMCLPRYHLNTTEQHFDPFGQDVGFKSAGQHLLYSAIDQMFRVTETPSFRYFRWDRFDTVNMWAHYLVYLGGYLNLTPLDLKSTFYTKVDDFFPTETRKAT